MQLLIIGTLEGQIGTASQIAIARGAKVSQASDVPSGLHALRSGQGADLVMIDATLNVAELVQAVTSERISVPIIACGTGTDADAAVRAIKAGAKEYIPLPPNPELIAAILTAVVEDNHTIIHADASMVGVLKLADQIAPSDAGILVTGASGTGKELIARHIHAKSRRANKRFVAVNCAAIPENLLESELFGHEKGAFTGAIARRIGKFEEAEGGTLLLDEVSEMETRMQAKLLRAVQEREIDRVGGGKPVPVDVRIIATSNRDLQAEVAVGNFREDLYFRLNVINLNLPSLAGPAAGYRDPRGALYREVCRGQRDVSASLSPEARQLLSKYDWPGNVRELENATHRAVLLSSADQIEPEAFGLTMHTHGGVGASSSQTEDVAGEGGLVGRTVSDVERELIINTLQHCLGNRTHAANILGISIRTLRNKLKQYGEGDLRFPGRETAIVRWRSGTDPRIRWLR